MKFMVDIETLAHSPKEGILNVLTDTKMKLDSCEKECNDCKKKLEDCEKELDDYKKMFEDCEEKLEYYKNGFEYYEKELETCEYEHEEYRRYAIRQYKIRKEDNSEFKQIVMAEQIADTDNKQ